MAYVARMAASQVSNPVAVLVLMKSDYSLHHRFTGRSQSQYYPVPEYRLAPARRPCAASGSLKRMPQDLERLRSEMESYLQQSGMTIFYGAHRMLDALLQVSWDTEGHADFHHFVDAAKSAGAKLIVFNQQSFSLDQIDAALDQVEECEFSREEKRQYESRLRKLQSYEGFTSSLEVSFVLEARVYSFEVHTDWYEAFTDILGELDAATEEDDVSEDGSLGGYFSNN